MQRNWNSTDDYVEILGGSLGNAKFTDVNFPTDDALFWPQFFESGGNADANVHWQRISEVAAFDDMPFFGPPDESGIPKTAISPEDIVQGAIGNCWI